MIAMHGGKVDVTGEIKHGKTSLVLHDGKGVLTGIPSPFPAIRYHSLAGMLLFFTNISLIAFPLTLSVGEESTIPDFLVVTSRTENGIVMGVRHKTLCFEGN
jgi:anthranilate/para-aminobenzoate synthase component II